MERDEALEILADGHSVITVEAARDVCVAVGVDFDAECRAWLVKRWHSDPPGTVKGLTMHPGQEGQEGVYTLSLSNYVAGKLGVDGGSFIGRGFQAQGNAKAIKAKLEEK